MQQEGSIIRRKEIVPSADETPTRAPFRTETRQGAIKWKMRQEYADLKLGDIIRRCPEGYLPSLTESLKDLRIRYNANERELVMVADVLVENRLAYIDSKNTKVKTPMTPDEAITAVRQFLAEQEPETVH
jgi:hypothetical protein